MEKQITPRNVTWDYARGIAIVMIVYHHLYPRFYSDPDFQPNSIAYLICYTCQLPIFMYVSGLFAKISINRYGVIDLIKNRAVRLLLPFFSFILIWVLIDSSFISSQLLKNFKGGYWFVLVLFEMMVLLSFSKCIARVGKTNQLYVIVYLYAVLTALKFAIPESNIINGMFSLNLLWHYFPFFILGYYNENIKWIFQKRYAIIAMLMYAVSIAYLYKTKSHSIIPLCNISSLILFITLFSKGVRPFERLFSKLGVYSLQIYLLHFLIGRFTRDLSRLDCILEEFVLDAVLTALFIVACLIVSNILMQNKWLALFLFGIKNKRGAGKTA